MIRRFIAGWNHRGRSPRLAVQCRYQLARGADADLLSSRAKRGICFRFGKSRSLVAALLGMTRAQVMLGVAIDASRGVGVGVRFLDRNREVHVGAIVAAATAAIDAGREDGLGAKAVLSKEAPHVTDTVRGEIERERAPAEDMRELRRL